jgi:uncharacterized protein (DUF169 family)
MESRLASALRLSSSPVAVVLADSKPVDALQFKEGAWGCVAATLIAVSKGRTAAFDRSTFGCTGGGTGLGFGNQYEQCGFAIDRLLSTGSGVSQDAESGLHAAEGERFFKSPEVVRSWLASVPFADVPAQYVVLKPIGLITADEHPELVVFFVNPDQLSALVVMSDYGRGTGDSVVAPFGGACQSILFGYAEAKRDRPRGVIGFFDIAQRLRIARDMLSFTAPWSLFLEMEANVDGSFLELEDWQKLRERQADG